MLAILTLTARLLIISDPASLVVDPNTIQLGMAPPALPWRVDLPKAIVRDEGVFLPTELGQEVLHHLLYLDAYYGLCQKAIDAEVVVRDEVMKADAAECQSKVDGVESEMWPDWLFKSVLVGSVLGGFVLGYTLHR